jgi:hypothetical protein
MFLFNLKSNLNNDSKIYNVKKKKKTSERKTLDYKHFEMIEYFHKLECQKIDKELLLVKYQKEYDDILINYNEITLKIDNGKINSNELDMYQKQKGQLYLELRKKGYIIDDLRVEIKKLENSVEENEYYNRVDDILFQYYSFFENNVDISNSKEIDDCDNESDLDDSDMEESLSDSGSEENEIIFDKNLKQCNNNCNTDNEIKKTKNIQSKPKVNNNIQSKSNILYFFGVNNANETGDQNSNENVKENEENECEIDDTQVNVIKKKKFTQKSDLHNEYIHQITKYYDPEIKRVNHTLCPDCNVEREILINEGKYYCPLCCGIDRLIVDSDRPSYKEPPPEVSYFAYKRINHFNQWLNQFQAKETSDIPMDVYDLIILELKKEKNCNLKKLKKKKMKEIMKKLGLTRYYENISHIIYKINGIHPPQIPPELEETLRNMFRSIQGPFIRSCAKIQKKRKNFLSYSYVLYKFLELLGFDELKKQFPLLKCREKLHKQDKIWQGICQELGWDFISSI